MQTHTSCFQVPFWSYLELSAVLSCSYLIFIFTHLAFKSPFQVTKLHSSAWCFSGRDPGSRLIKDDRRSGESQFISHSVGFHWWHTELKSTLVAINYQTIAGALQRCFCAAYWRHDVRFQVWPYDRGAYISPCRMSTPPYTVTSLFVINGSCIAVGGGLCWCRVGVRRWLWASSQTKLH